MIDDVKEYIIVEVEFVSSSIVGEMGSALESKVNKKIQEGWKPLGGICVSGYRLFQAMVKEK